VPNNHILTTYGGTEFLPGQGYFSQTLTGEAVLYFASEENLSPVMQSQAAQNEPEAKSALFSSAATAESVEELAKKSGAISATALFIVPRYGNRKKSIDDLTMKFKNTCEGANLGEHISELRAKELEAAVAKIAASAATEAVIVDPGKKDDKKKLKKKKKVSTEDEVKEEPVIETERSVFDTDSDGNKFDLFGDGKSQDSKGIFGDDGNSGSGSGKSLW
jgi:hypothetical protein